MSQLNVTIVTPRYPPAFSGGGEISVQLLAENLQDRDEIGEVEVFSFDGGDESVVNGIKVNRFSPVYKLPRELSNVYVARVLEQISNSDIIHSYNMTFHPAVGYISNKNGIDSVGTLNNYQYVLDSTIGLSWSDRPLKKAYKRISYETVGKKLIDCMRNMDKYTALSNSVAEIYNSQTLPFHDIEVIPNMLDQQFGLRSNSLDRDPTPNVIKVLYVGALSNIKGVDYLIKAFEHLPASYTLTVVGKGELDEKIDTLISSQGLGNQITLKGFVSHADLPELYRKSDIFVHPGIWPEPFGRTLLEAMQFGLPVVSTDIGGPKDIVMDDELLCEPRNPKALAEAIQRASSKPRKPRAYETYVKESYSSEKIIKQVVDVYQSLNES